MKGTDRFSGLEQALEEAIRQSLSEAKKVEKSDSAAAVSRMREFKGYQQEMQMLQAARHTNGEPASYRYYRHYSLLCYGYFKGVAGKEKVLQKQSYFRTI